MGRLFSLCLLIALGCGGARVGLRGATSSGDCANELTYRCLGAMRVRRHIVAGFATAAPRGDGGSIRRAVDLDVQEAVPAIRAILANDPDVRRRLAAARALADLRDAQSAPQVAALARAAEEIGSGAWEAARDALEAFGTPAALPYALDWIARHPQLTTPADVSRAHWVTRIVMAENERNALPALQGWAAQVESARLDRMDAVVLSSLLYGARMQLDEQPFRARMQRALGTRDAVVPTQPENTLLGLGHHVGDAPGLGRFAGSLNPDAALAYDGIDRLVEVLARAERDPRTQRDAARARTALVERLSSFTAMREDPNHPNFAPDLWARHHASLARLGVAASQARLIELAQRAELGKVALVAALQALRIDAPGAADATFALLLASTSGELPWQHVVALLDQAAHTMGQADGRWSVALFDRSEAVRQRALFQMARIRPSQACHVVTSAALTASDETVRPALTALTTLGPSCRRDLLALAEGRLWLPPQYEHRNASPRARGAAIEVLAMLGDRSWLARDEPALRGSIECARNIAALP